MRARNRLGGLAAFVITGLPLAALAQEEAAWTEIRPGIAGERPIAEGSAVLSLEAPKRAEDAALVPVTVRLAPGAPAITRLTLVVDENPAPVVGTVTFPGGQRDFSLSTRVRVNSYSYVRALAETEDGRLFMVKDYVKAAGGCSAPAVKDPAEARAHVGEMRFRAFADLGEAQVQLRHPNATGMQMDQVTRLYTPAWYVEHLDIRQGDVTLMSLEGGISISEDPTFRFTYRASGAPVSVEARDNEGHVFRASFPGGGS